MTGGSAEKAIDQLLAAINQGKDLPRRYQPGVALGFPDLDVFTPEALDRIKALAGGDPARTARLSAHVLKIAQRECAMPVLPDLVDDAAAQIDMERAEAQPDDEHSAPPTDRLSLAPQGMPLPEPSARYAQTEGPQSGGPQTGDRQTGGAAPGVSVPRRMVRRAAGVLGVLLIAAGVAGYLAYSGRLDTFGGAREIVISTLAAIGVVPPGGEKQEGGSGDSGASSPTERTAESDPPAGSSGEPAIAEDDRRDEIPNEAVAADHLPRENDRRADEAALAERWPAAGSSGEAAIAEDDRRDEIPNEAVATDHLPREDDRRADEAALAERWPAAGSSGEPAIAEDDRRDEIPNEAVATDHPPREDDRRADEAALAERWPELGEAAENAIQQRFREVREQAEQLHRRQYEEMQARHARELSQAGAEGADALAQAKDRHQQERAALQRDRDANREFLAAVHGELDQQLKSARRDVARARQDAAAAGQGESGAPRAISGRLPVHEQPGTPAVSSPAVAAFPEDSTAADPVAAESGLQPQTDDRQQQSAAMTLESGPESGMESGAESGQPPGENPGENPVMAASGQTEPPQDEALEPAAPQMTERPTDQEATPRTGQPAMASSPPAEPVPGAVSGAAAPQAAEVASASEPTPESHLAAAPVGQDVADLINRGNALLDLGDLASARLFYQLAAGRGSPEGAMLMGMTFDPVYFARTGIQGTQPRIQDALHWYDQAIVMGSRPAEGRMAELRSWLEQSAAAGDARAKAALQQLR
jgi:hypothetical protein